MILGLAAYSCVNNSRIEVDSLNVVHIHVAKNTNKMLQNQDYVFSFVRRLTININVKMQFYKGCTLNLCDFP